MFCINCGQKINEGTIFCPGCGQKQAETSGSSAPQAQEYRAPVATVVNVQPQAMPTQQHAAYPAVKPKKKHGCLTAFLIVFAILIIGGAGVYFFLPGLSSPVNLGIKSSREAYESTMNKLDIVKDESPRQGAADDYTITYGSAQKVDAGLTSEELTSFFNENRPSYYAVKDVQVRVNDDGSIEASGKLDTGYVFITMLGGQYTKEDAKSALPMLGIIPDNVNVYFKMSGSVQDNQIQGLDVASVKVMGIPIPLTLINSNMSFVTNTLDKYISNECARVGAYIEHMEADNGKIDFQGSLPSSVKRTSIG